jgi:hypothetical protein
MSRLALFGACVMVVIATGAVRADERSEQRMRFLASQLVVPLAEFDEGQVGLALLLDTLGALASPPGGDTDPDKTVKIVLSVAFNQLDKGTFDAGFVVRPDFIEIVPLRILRQELNYPNGFADELRSLAVGFYDKVPLHTALKDLGERYDRNVVLSPLAEKELEKTISARLLNVPVETAVETLADMADLKIVRKANVFFVTTKEQAATLTAEQEKRMKAEQERVEKTKTHDGKLEGLTKPAKR